MYHIIIHMHNYVGQRILGDFGLLRLRQIDSVFPVKGWLGFLGFF